MPERKHLSDRMLRVYEINKNKFDLDAYSCRQLATLLGISKTSAIRILRHHKRVTERDLTLSNNEQPASTQRKSTSNPNGTTHLIIGDAHAAPNQNLHRFTLLGRMVRDIRPDVVISIGDWADMPSLSSYHKGKRSFEGRRYSADIASANEALRLYHRELADHNRAFPSDQVNPRHVYCEGNHEWRIARACEDSPGLDVIDLSDIEFEKRGWEVFRFLDHANIDGINYCHYFTSQNTSRAISGVNAARNLLMKKHVTCVVGHSHLLNHYSTIAGDKRIHGLVVGWYCDAYKEYAKQSNPGWWNGICVLRNVKDGDFDLETWSYERIKRTWDKK